MNGQERAGPLPLKVVMYRAATLTEVRARVPAREARPCAGDTSEDLVVPARGHQPIHSDSAAERWP